MFRSCLVVKGNPVTGCNPFLKAIVKPSAGHQQWSLVSGQVHEGTGGLQHILALKLHNAMAHNPWVSASFLAAVFGDKSQHTANMVIFCYTGISLNQKFANFFISRHSIRQLTSHTMLLAGFTSLNSPINK